MQNDNYNFIKTEEIRRLKELDEINRREKQLRVKTIKVLEIVKLFLSNDMTIQEVAEKINTSRSTVQRALNEKQIIIDQLGNDMYEQVHQKLIKSKEEGLIKGGKNSFSNNQFTKDELGHFTGSKKR